jgi:hypothetical protein
MGSQRPPAWKLAADLIRGAADQALDYADSLARSQAESLWKRAVGDLDRHCEQLADGLESEFSAGHGTGGYHGDTMPGHPLSWYAEFSPRSRRPTPDYRPRPGMTEHEFATELIGAALRDSTPALATVGVQVDFRQTAGTLRYSSAVTRGGNTIAEGPSGVINAPHGAAGSAGQIKAAVRDIGDFIDGNAPLVYAQLREITADQSVN